MTDRNFDDLAERFQRRLYDKPKGKIRLQIAQESLLQDCPELTHQQGLRVLDAGCGFGQMSQFIAGLGHKVTACDHSAELLTAARQRIEEADAALLENIDFVHSSFQALPQSIDREFDLIIFHAVLEWLDDPPLGLKALVENLKSGGQLSLMFYNRHGLMFRNLLRGDFTRFERGTFSGEQGGLTPQNPLVPEEVADWLQEMNMQVQSRRGIRSFYDYMAQANTPKRLEKIDLAEVIKYEKEFGVQEPYRGLARYQLWHCLRA